MSVLAKLVRGRARARGGRDRARYIYATEEHDTIRQRVLEALLHEPRGMTYSELAQQLGTHPNCITGRIHALRAMGHVQLGGSRKSWVTQVESKVWVATAHAHAFHAPDARQVRLETWGR